MLATGCVDVDVDTAGFDEVGARCCDVWDGNQEGVYVPTDMPAQMICTGYSVRTVYCWSEMRTVWPLCCAQETKSMLCSTGLMTPKHIGKSNIFWAKKQADKWLRLLVSELYTRWSRGLVRAFPLINMS